MERREVLLASPLVHEGGWCITGNADHHLTFTSPFGRDLASSPEPLRSDVRRRVSDATGLRLGDPTPQDPDGEADSADAADEPAHAMAGTALDLAPPCRWSGTPQRRRGP